MKTFLSIHQDKIVGTLSMFDRMIFKGYLTGFFPKGAFGAYLWRKGVLLKDFGNYVEERTQTLKAHLEGMAQAAYLSSSKESKEELARAIAERDGITEGLVCIFSVLESCMSFDVRGNHQTHKLEVVRRQRKCLHYYAYYLDREFGLMHLRLQSWFPFDLQIYVNGREWLARTMGAAEAELANIRRGALLHDIGKMGVPDSILLKPDKLTDEEWETMRKHPMYAYEMLSPIHYLRPALDIPYCHHEKWDGSGYPRGLQGEGIPLAARIFAVVDVWDALTSDRPYRKAWKKENALEYIREQAGKHFDTRLERDVALKIIRTEQFAQAVLERILKRFEREAKALARLTHPNIVPVIDYGEHEGAPYLVMPYLPGGTLKQKLGRPMPWQDAVRLLMPVAQAWNMLTSKALFTAMSNHPISSSPSRESRRFPTLESPKSWRAKRPSHSQARGLEWEHPNTCRQSKGWVKGLTPAPIFTRWGSSSTKWSPDENPLPRIPRWQWSSSTSVSRCRVPAALCLDCRSRWNGFS